MGLTIVSVAYPFAAVGPDAVGGAEQVVSLLDAALVRAGHQSVVIACAGSRVAGRLLPIPAPPERLDAQAQSTAHAAVQARLRQAMTMYQVDLVHLHGLDCDRYLPEDDVPALLTLHLDPGLYAGELFDRPRSNLYVQCVSETQQRTCGSSGPRVVETIANGVPVDRLLPGQRKAAFALCLGRICAEKGFHLAIAAARQAGVPLVIAGEVHPYSAHQDYFRREIEPHVDGSRVRFVGPVGATRKRRLLALARCLLVPSQTRETSSLVAMEAMACGTPVIAFRAGALPEILSDNETGLLVDTVEDMASAITRVDSIDSHVCRDRAVERFSAEKMTEQYLMTYAHLCTSPSRAVEVEEVTSVPALQRLREEWLQLWRRVPGASIFQHPDWLIPWCAPFQVREPWLIALRRDRRLIGVVPLVVYPRGPERVLTLMGAGVSDDQNALLEPDEANACMARLWAVLLWRRHAFDVLELEALPHDSALWQHTPTAGWHVGRRVLQDVRPVLQLTPEARTLEKVTPARLMKEIRYQHRRAERDGLPISVTLADAAAFDELFRQFVHLHRLRWRGRGQAEVLSDDRVSFYEEVGRQFIAVGILRLYVLHLGDAPASAFYGFHANGRTLYYLSGFDPAFERYSPGTLVVAHALERALLDDRAQAFDFLRGAEAYKYAWGAEDELLYCHSLKPSRAG
jgi:CelD/BcsL family acetyltransferase involved in cellulose biosynthesis/glycosyltransferase involved in cell wall biosynthesis